MPRSGRSGFWIPTFPHHAVGALRPTAFASVSGGGGAASSVGLVAGRPRLRFRWLAGGGGGRGGASSSDASLLSASSAASSAAAGVALRVVADATLSV